MEINAEVTISDRTDILQINHDALLSYQDYRARIADLHLQHLVTGHEQSETLLNYSKLNEQRMNRWDKHYQPSNDLLNRVLSAPAKLHFVAISEGWCGDAAQIIPAIYKMVTLREDWQFSVVLRDENPDWMNLFLTDGARAIPIIVVFDESKKYLFHWGPRPNEASQLIAEAKANGVASDIWKTDLHKWYAQNKQSALEAEWMKLLKV